MWYSYNNVITMYTKINMNLTQLEQIKTNYLTYKISHFNKLLRLHKIGNMTQSDWFVKLVKGGKRFVYKCMTYLLPTYHDCNYC
jgi:hypothetical protein